MNREASQKQPSFLIYTLGGPNVASSRVRAYWVAEELESLGASAELFHGESRMDLLRFMTKIPRHDVIMFQKCYSRWHRKLMWLANRMGKFTIIDLDDAPSRTNEPTTLRNVEAMMSMASATVVGSPNLQRYADDHSSNTVLIPSSIRLANYQVANRASDSNEKITLGWIGNGKHYCDDLIQILTPVLTELAKSQPIRFKLVGACEVEQLHQQFNNIPGLEAELIDGIEWSDPQKVSAAIADFDIGLYPLLPKEFNHFKCGFKALEYMAIGIPTVASPVSVTDGIVTHGETGFLPQNLDEWTSYLANLINDTTLRHRMGQTSRGKVENEFNVRHAAQTLISMAAT